MRNIFDQYTQPENKLTHALISCLNEDKYLLKSFLKSFCNNFFNKLLEIKIEEQSIPGFNLEKNQKLGLPDAVLYDNEKCLIIESKVASKLTKDQLIRHQNTIYKRGFSSIRGLALVIDLNSRIDLEQWYQIRWTKIYNWVYNQKPKSDWAKKLEDYFKVLENSMVADKYLKEGSITEFTGISFNEDNPYSYNESKRQLKLLTNKIRQNKELSEKLNIDLSSDGRSGIKKAGIQWDYLSFNTGKEKKFTDEPHFTIGIGSSFLDAFLTIPYRIKGKTKKNLKDLSWESFNQTIYQISLNYKKYFGISNGFKPQIVIAQRRYANQSSPAIHDAHLVFDMRTAFEDKESKLKPKLKKQEEWLRVVYDLINNRRSNLQFQIGAHFFYNKNSLVNNNDADKVLCKSFLACKPFVDILFKN